MPSIDQVISQLRKKKQASIKPTPENPMIGLMNKLNYNLIGAMADIAQAFMDKKTDLSPIVKAIKEIPSIKPTDMSVVIETLRTMPKPKDMDMKPVIDAIKNIPRAERPPEEIKIKNQIALDKVESLLSQQLTAFQASKRSSGKKDDQSIIKELRSLFGELSQAVLLTRVDAVRVINPGDFPVSPAKTAYKNAAGEVSDGLVDADHHVQVDVLTMPSVTVSTGDIEIGAVEIKNSTDDTRATVGANGLHVDVQASALPTGAATSAKQLADNHNVVVTSAPTTAVTGTFWQATQPVSGTVTSNLSATDNAVLDSIDTAVTSKLITGIGHGVAVVTTAGTDVALAASTPCKKVDIQAQTDNTSYIAVGASGVDATIATGTGVLLNPGDTYSLEIDNLADIYIDSLVNGEGVRFSYYT
jgi:hypothetical protein